jgi:hypothetical protein
MVGFLLGVALGAWQRDRIVGALTWVKTKVIG